jgi:hypothetical protein
LPSVGPKLIGAGTSRDCGRALAQLDITMDITKTIAGRLSSIWTYFGNHIGLKRDDDAICRRFLKINSKMVLTCLLALMVLIVILLFSKVTGERKRPFWAEKSKKQVEA